MTQTGDREIRSVSGRLPDNPGELARMGMVFYRQATLALNPPGKSLRATGEKDSCSGTFFSTA